MATLYLTLPAPSNFNVAMPDQWPRWKQNLNCSKKDWIIRGRGGKINKYPIVLPGGRHSKYFSAEDARIYSSVVLQKAGQHFGSWKKHSRVTTGSPE